MQEISYNLKMDQPRKIILEKAEDGVGSLKKWSIAIGMNETYLQQFIRKGSPKNLPEDLRHKLSKASGIPEHMLRGSNVRKLAPIKRPPVLKVNIQEFRFIGGFDQAASAGTGAFVNNNTAVPMHFLAFRRDWLRNISNASDDDLFVLFVDGGSMEPTIHNGDSILVDKTQRNPRKDGIYVFMWDGLINVKRLTADPRTKTISISSDNPAHRSYDGAKPEDIEVIGRVIWIGRKV